MVVGRIDEGAVINGNKVLRQVWNRQRCGQVVFLFRFTADIPDSPIMVLHPPASPSMVPPKVWQTSLLIGTVKDNADIVESFAPGSVIEVRRCRSGDGSQVSDSTDGVTGRFLLGRLRDDD